MRALSKQQLATLKRRVYSANYRASREYDREDTISLEDVLGLFTKNQLCAYCQRKLTPSTLSLDHRIPLVAGGSNTAGNIELVCRRDNRYKSAIPAEQYTAFLKHLGEEWSSFFFSHYRPHNHRRGRG